MGCSNCITVINNAIACYGACYIRGFTVMSFFMVNCLFYFNQLRRYITRLIEFLFHRMGPFHVINTSTKRYTTYWWLTKNGIRALIILKKTYFPTGHNLNRDRSPTWLDVLRHDQIIFSEIEYCVSQVFLGTVLPLPANIKTNHFRYENNYILHPAVRRLLNMARQSTLILPPMRKWH